MRKATIKTVAPGVRTTTVMNSRPADWFVPGWDKAPGAAQHREALDARIDMGQKMTPLGPGTLKKE